MEKVEITKVENGYILQVNHTLGKTNLVYGEFNDVVDYMRAVFNEQTDSTRD